MRYVVHMGEPISVYKILDEIVREENGCSTDV
jgi:hypothetical protein